MKILTLAAVILATTSTTSECDPPAPKACSVSLRGLQVENGMVTDIVTPTCKKDKLPLRHVIEVYLDYRGPGDEFTPLSPKHIVKPGIPDEKGFDINVTGECVKGYYRTHYHVSGKGPPLDDGPGGSIPFEYEDTGWPTFFDVEDCTA